MKKWLFNKAEQSPLRKWALGLTGWKFVAWQLIGPILFLIVFELFLNLLGQTMLPWKW